LLADGLSQWDKHKNNQQEQSPGEHGGEQKMHPVPPRGGPDLNVPGAAQALREPLQRSAYSGNRIKVLAGSKDPHLDRNPADERQFGEA
jgi:hypothetical protein